MKIFSNKKLNLIIILIFLNCNFNNLLAQDPSVGLSIELVKSTHLKN